jgi:DNA-binding response OmpR family regulator
MAAILMIDDDERFAAMTKQRLEKISHTVVVHTEATTAIPLIAAGDYDLLVLDLNMPGLSGTDLLAVMKNLPALANAKVLLYSSGDAVRLAEIATEYGVSVLEKSATGEELGGKIAELIA